MQWIEASFRTHSQDIDALCEKLTELGADGLVIEDEADVEEKGDIEGYALQFGCYSEEASAEKAMTDTGMDGLQVISQDSMYKIIGDIYETKEEARDALEEVPEDVSAFVTTVYGQQ